ncbi:hypothetical protein ACTQ33_16520 [Candidatus Avoscillospira sp. LCP25S3_F1]|uniref:hypothetical protein n=1 Tax=Candidatus Avoscillospira sp. LCP25S3_F1 TaxID=3438825 RepID=UPI003F91CE56
MNVTFCGHSQITKEDKIASWLRSVTQSLIEQGATTFFLGGYGEFDSLAASILREQKKKYPQIELVLVLAYLNTGRNTSGYDSTVYPPLETVPRRFAISHRNRWMVEASDVVSCPLPAWPRNTGRRIVSWDTPLTALAVRRNPVGRPSLWKSCTPVKSAAGIAVIFWDWLI